MPVNQTLRSRLGPTYRRWRKRLDNPEVKHARLLAQRLGAGSPGVVHLGASECKYVGPDDIDQRPLPIMVANALAPDVSIYGLAEAGYNPKLFRSYVEILGAHQVRPIVLLSLTVRFGLLPWSEHPEYGFGRSVDALRRIDPKSPPWRFHAAVRLTRESDFVELDRIEYPTIDGTRTIGEFRRTLKDTSVAGLQGDDRIRRLYAYHQGGTIGAGYLKDITDLGTRLRELGLPAVVYHTPIPVDRGVELLGEQLRERVVQNLASMDQAFIAGYGPIDILQTGTMLDSGEFINPDHAIEHANERGRKRMTDLICEEVRRQAALLRDRPS